MLRRFGRLLEGGGAGFRSDVLGYRRYPVFVFAGELRAKASSELSDLADGMKEDVAHSDSGTLEGYRRTTSGPDTYLVMTRDGTLSIRTVPSRTKWKTIPLKEGAELHTSEKAA